MLKRARSFLKSALTRGPSGESVTLRPTDQIAMLYLLRFGKVTAEDLHRELSATRGADDTETGETIVRLLTEQLVEARYLPEEGTAAITYVITKRGSRLKRRIPPEPRSVTEFWF